MIDDKNQIIRSMRSYEVGGSTDDSCMEEYMDASGKKRRRRKKSGCGKVTRYRTSSGGGGGGGRALGAILGVGASIGAGLGLKKMLKKEQNGGSVKKRMGGPIGDGKFLKNNPKLAAKIANAKTVIRNVKKIVKPRTKG